MPTWSWEEDREDGEGVRDAVPHNAGSDDTTRGQEGTACLGRFSGWEEEGCFFEGAELLL